MVNSDRFLVAGFGVLRKGSGVRRFVGLVVVAVVALAACGGDDAEQDGSTESTAGSTESTAGSTESTVSSSGGSLRAGAAQGISQLNPATRTFGWEQTLFSLLWNGLTKPAQDGSVEPDLAVSWEALEDGLRWRFSLRDDVVFSNGKALTADDVVATFDYYLDPSTATQEAGKLAVIEDVTAVDPLTVEFVLSSPNQWFPDAIQYVKVLDMSSLESMDSSPVVTGPFAVTEFVPNDRLVLERNESYFGEPALLDQIEFVTQNDPTAALTALAAGDLDVFWAVPSGDAGRIAEGSDPNLKMINPNGPGQSPFWHFDVSAPPFDDVRVRQAFAYAVDREAILDAAYSGQGQVSNSNSFIADDSPWFGGNDIDYSFDLERAAELFAEAGIDGDDTFTWWGVSNQYPEWNLSGQILQQSLAEIGIELTIENNEIGTWAGRFFPAGKDYPGLVVPNFLNNPTNPAFALSFYAPDVCVCNWSDDEFTAAYDAALATPNNPDEGASAWHEVQRILNREIPMLVPLQASTGAAARSNVNGVWLESGAVLHLENATID